MNKKVPEGVDHDKFMSCVEEVQAKGHTESSAYAICTTSMTRGVPVADLLKGAEMNDKLNIFVPMVKYNAEKHIGYGVLAEEAPDKSGEIFDYATSKALFQEWSEGFKKITDGASAGNLRSMHGKTAAGKFLEISFDDAGKKIPVSFKVVDPVDQAKCAEGVYTGLSIGGEYVKRWPKDEKGLVRYTARPAEGSLVDNPCMYGATFEYIKADGADPELRKFIGEQKSAIERGLDYLMKSISPASLLSIIGAAPKPAEKIAAREDVTPKEGKSKYGDVKFADEANKKYPIDTAKHIRAAYNYIRKPKNRAKYSSKDAATIERKIIAAWKSKIDNDGPPSAQKEAIEGGLIKDWGHVSSLASALSSLDYTLELMERMMPDSAALKDLEAARQMFGEGVAALAGECAVDGEYDDMTGEQKAAPAPAQKVDEPKQQPAPALDADAVKKSFEAVVKAQTDEAVKGIEQRISKTLGESVEPLKKSLTEIREVMSKVEKDLEKVKRTPAEAGTPIRTVEKSFTPGSITQEMPISIDDVNKFIGTLTRSGASEAATNEIRLALAAKLMPH